MLATPDHPGLLLEVPGRTVRVDRELARIVLQQERLVDVRSVANRTPSAGFAAASWGVQSHLGPRHQGLFAGNRRGDGSAGRTGGPGESDTLHPRLDIRDIDRVYASHPYIGSQAHALDRQPESREQHHEQQHARQISQAELGDDCHSEYRQEPELSSRCARVNVSLTPTASKWGR